ncbi:baseplate J/gp47 family protein [Undibacterium rugosum]|uniref:baseplate J/gp47 family protein n=1 Tax=Undibacterium rugosum TaxID=2762291 RepID=UPI001B82CA22|nr:baseplate J/gp47 family protein [Undibacterium rugosum]MBR7777373.1 baseplate J/gp47 family protein [Undibacterium rugosum]
MSLSIDLSNLPVPDVVEPIDFETIYAERKAAFVALYPTEQRAEIVATLALESEPISKLLQENAYREMVWRQRVNDAARSVMLTFARGTDLDQLAGNFNVARLIVTPANANTFPPTPAVMETDDALRERALQAFEGLSVAGPRNAYIFHARSADGRVADASAISPAPAEVVVSILAVAGDGSAPDDLVHVVELALNDENVRPVGDRLTVQAAKVVRYTIDATLYLDQGPEAEPILLEARRRVDLYRNTLRRLGRHINRSAIIAALHAEGVKKVDLHAPLVDIVIDQTQAAYCFAVTIANGGADD